MVGKLTIAFTRKEAELYHAHGLHREALELYNRLLQTLPEENLELKSVIEARIACISQSLQDRSISEKSISAQQIAQLRQGWGALGAAERMSCAEAFMQIGCYREALKELIAALREDSSAQAAIADTAICIGRIYPAKEAPAILERIAASLVTEPGERDRLRRALLHKLAELRKEGNESKAPNEPGSIACAHPSPPRSAAPLAKDAPAIAQGALRASIARRRAEAAFPRRHCILQRLWGWFRGSRHIQPEGPAPYRENASEEIA